MSKILFRLSGVSEEEASEVRALLEEHEIDFYETTAGNWGVSLAAIWVRDESQFEGARALLDKYQQERTVRMKAEYAHLKETGQNKTIVDNMKDKPIQMVFCILVVGLIVYLSIRLITDLGQL